MHTMVKNGDDWAVGYIREGLFQTVVIVSGWQPAMEFVSYLNGGDLPRNSFQWAKEPDNADQSGEIPQDIIDEWVKQCDCCGGCSEVPCDGVMTGGLCDSVPCHCGDLGDDAMHDDGYTHYTAN